MCVAVSFHSLDIKFTEEEINKILAANSAGSRWEQLDEVKDKKYWKTEGGRSTAFYHSKNGSLVIFSNKWIEGKKDKEKALRADGLDQF